MPEPVAIELEWTSDLLMEVSYLNLSSKEARARRVRFLRLSPIFLIAGALVGAGIGYYGFVIPDAVLWFCFGAIVMRIVVTHIYARILIRRRIKSELASPIRQGTTRLTLSDGGILTEQEHMTTDVGWRAVTAQQEGKLALHLMLSDALAQPIPDAVLPAGIDRADLCRRIENWRAKAAA